MVMPDDPDATARFVGAGTIAAGLLVVALCGSCTAAFVGGLVWSAISGDPGAGAVPFLMPIPLIIGGGPTLGGILLVRRGLRRRRNARPPPSSAPPPG